MYNIQRKGINNGGINAMRVSDAEYKEELIREIKWLPSAKIKEVLDFVCFLKAKESIDTAQSYFWTKKWQAMEHEADDDKKVGRIIGDGTVVNLLKELKS